MRTSQRSRSGWRAERNERARGSKKVLKEERGQERRQGLNRGDGRRMDVKGGEEERIW